MKALPLYLSPLFCIIAVLCLSPPSASAGWDFNFDLTQGATLMNGGSEDAASKLFRSTQERSKRRGKKKKGKGGIRYKKPNYKIKAPVQSEADRLREKEGGLEYLKGNGLSPETPLARKPLKKK